MSEFYHYWKENITYTPDKFSITGKDFFNTLSEKTGYLGGSEYDTLIPDLDNFTFNDFAGKISIVGSDRKSASTVEPKLKALFNSTNDFKEKNKTRHFNKLNRESTTFNKIRLKLSDTGDEILYYCPDMNNIDDNADDNIDDNADDNIDDNDNSDADNTDDDNDNNDATNNFNGGKSDQETDMNIMQYLI